MFLTSNLMHTDMLSHFNTEMSYFAADLETNFDKFVFS